MNIIQRRKFINAIHDPMSNISDESDMTSFKIREHPYHPQQLYKEEVNDRNEQRSSDEILTKRLTDDLQHLPLGFFIPGPESYYGRYNITGNDDRNNRLDEREEITNVDQLRERASEIKHILVMSDKEQEALARMDSIISQLHITRNLIRRRWYVLFFKSI